MLNQVILIGRLGRDPEIRDSGDRQMVTFSLATTERWKTADGYETRSEWHDIVVFGALSKVTKYLTKGTLVYLEGMLRKREYQAKDGSKRTAVNVVLSGPDAKIIILADGKKKTETSHAKEQQSYDDDIPF